MTMFSQTTIAKKIELSGIGLHSGRKVCLEMLPAPVNTGIVFKRSDLPNAKPISAIVTSVSSTDLCTTIGSGENRVSTIEHLMAALAGLGIDNIHIRIDGPEVPILDGSAALFVEALLAAGAAPQNVGRRFFVVKEAFELKQGDKFVRVQPSDSLSFECSIDFASSIIGKQAASMEFSRQAFLALSGARTFCHINDVNAMRKVGLALGGSLDNAIVVSDNQIMNSDGLRIENEFAKHKLLDFLGDLALFGAPIIGKFTTHKSGHGLHANFVAELLRMKKQLLSVVESPEFSSENFPQEKRKSFANFGGAFF